MNMDPITDLMLYVKYFGPIKAVRVSSARARGKAKSYSYWGAARYEIRFEKSRKPRLIYKAIEAASSDRRAHHLAMADAQAIAEREHRIVLDSFDGSNDIDCEHVLMLLRKGAAQ